MSKGIIYDKELNVSVTIKSIKSVNYKDKEIVCSVEEFIKPEAFNTQIAKRGQGSATTYLLIPKAVRNNLQNKSKYDFISIGDDFMVLKKKEEKNDTKRKYI